MKDKGKDVSMKHIKTVNKKVKENKHNCGATPCKCGAALPKNSYIMCNGGCC